MVALTAVAACGGGASTVAPTATPTPTTSVSASTGAGAIDPSAIPLGDGHVSTSPTRGDVVSCQTGFPPGGGAQVVGPWIDAVHGTWNSTTKLVVQGSVSWPAAHFSVTVSGNTRTVQTTDLPINHTTGVFPIAASDPAFSYDRNPNTIRTQSINWSLPATPQAASSPSCTPGGAIGVLNDGVLLFNALDGEGRDAGAHEVLDACGEHPQMNGVLHHHSVPSCILDKATAASTLVGYAVDGYGIYVERSADGRLLTNTDLDACHGRTSRVDWDGSMQTLYHYDATVEYPYTVACFHGTPIAVS
ncbi:MAG: YHYH protein [Candidatus Dormibacteraeota bacterium]|nr:YHYH protein [Candidatus Dormibacteraeota bacterium]